MWNCLFDITLKGGCSCGYSLHFCISFGDLWFHLFNPYGFQGNQDTRGLCNIFLIHSGKQDTCSNFCPEILHPKWTFFSITCSCFHVFFSSSYFLCIRSFRASRTFTTFFPLKYNILLCITLIGLFFSGSSEEIPDQRAGSDTRTGGPAGTAFRAVAAVGL